MIIFLKSIFRLQRTHVPKIYNVISLDLDAAKPIIKYSFSQISFMSELA